MGVAVGDSVGVGVSVGCMVRVGDGIDVIVIVAVRVAVNDAVAVMVVVGPFGGVEVGVLGDVETGVFVGLGETSIIWLGIGVSVVAEDVSLGGKVPPPATVTGVSVGGVGMGSPMVPPSTQLTFRFTGSWNADLEVFERSKLISLTISGRTAWISMYGHGSYFAARLTWG